jgi:hypothetical protein
MRRREPGADGAPVGLAHRILEELVFERLRLTVDLCELLEFHADLSASIQRAVEGCAATEEERSGLVLAYLEQAWTRLSGEVRAELAEQERASGGAERLRGRLRGEA